MTNGGIFNWTPPPSICSRSAQMIAGGIDLIWSPVEVAFIQNLIYYIGRAYRTPDYGIWERGNKINSGHR